MHLMSLINLRVEPRALSRQRWHRPVTALLLLPAVYRVWYTQGGMGEWCIPRWYIPRVVGCGIAQYTSHTSGCGIAQYTLHTSGCICLPCYPRCICLPCYPRCTIPSGVPTVVYHTQWCTEQEVYTRVCASCTGFNRGLRPGLLARVPDITRSTVASIPAHLSTFRQKGEV